jgi:hypothetical protein
MVLSEGAKVFPGLSPCYPPKCRAWKNYSLPKGAQHKEKEMGIFYA